MIELQTVICNSEARDGTWCKLPYPGHLKGCPNFPKCPAEFQDFRNFYQHYKWYAIIEEFNLKAHSEKMKLLYPWWTERQRRNLLYWQGTIRKRLKRKTYEQVGSSGDIVLEIPEACGVNVFETMALVGVQIDRHPDIVRKVMMLGRRR